jgi:hypothetical protein
MNDRRPAIAAAGVAAVLSLLTAVTAGCGNKSADSGTAGGAASTAAPVPAVTPPPAGTVVGDPRAKGQIPNYTGANSPYGNSPEAQRRRQESSAK